jgi:hypothetical protein
MTRTLLLILTLCAPLALGCRRGTGQSAPAPGPRSNVGAQAPENPAVMAARRNAPVLDRALTGNDLNSLKQFMDQYRVVSGHYPRNLNELKEAFGNEGQKLFQLVSDNEIVMTWHTGEQGVLAYAKGAQEAGGMVLTVNGVQRMTADELKQALSGAGR